MLVDIENQKCKHRHSYYKPDGSFDHPFCFRERQWYEYDNMRVGYYDLETETFFGNTNILSYAIKERNKDNYQYNYLQQSDRVGDYRSWDRYLVEELLDEMNKYDVLIGYNASVFDRPMVFTRSLYHKLPYFAPKSKGHLDLYFALRGKVRLPRKNLKMMTEFLGIKGKTSLSEYWQRFVHGDYSDDVLNELKTHNIEDCKILESLHRRYEPFVKFNKTWL
jgi:DNA polymerase elongation subunit (family B)